MGEKELESLGEVPVSKVWIVEGVFHMLVNVLREATGVEPVELKEVVLKKVKVTKSGQGILLGHCGLKVLALLVPAECQTGGVPS